MKLSDVYNNRLDESLDNPYPIHKRSQTTYDIDADGITIRVFLNGMLIDGVNCLSLKFVNPLETVHAMDATNVHGNAALRVFASLVALTDPIKFNLLICVADDTSVEVEEKKRSLYMVVLRKLERMGKVHGVRTINITGFDKPIHIAERGIALDDQRVQELVAKFAHAHLS